MSKKPSSEDLKTKVLTEVQMLKTYVSEDKGFSRPSAEDSDRRSSEDFEELKFW